MTCPDSQAVLGHSLASLKDYLYRVTGVLPTIAYFCVLVLMLAVGKSWRTPHHHILLLLVLMLAVGKSRRTPDPYTVLLMLLLTRELCEDGEHG